MKINRLLEITIILLNKGTVTAKEMAERFGVSTRTIYRDVEELSLSGVPVYCNRGIKGGISLIEDYAINRTLLTNSESEKILIALGSLQKTNIPGVEEVLDKLGAIFKNKASEWIQVDDTPWGSDPNQQNKFTEIKKALLDCRIISFDYISRNNIREHRTIYPMRLLYKGNSWYLNGYCTMRKDIRLFRISRIKSLRVQDNRFKRAEYDSYLKLDKLDNTYINKYESICLKFKEEALYRLYDEYDDDIIQKNPDGTYHVILHFEVDDWLYGYILSFGSNVYVESPDYLRETIKKKINEMYKEYS
jgi:predicted DNA-binding transcriptional regulator YafY